MPEVVAEKELLKLQTIRDQRLVNVMLTGCVLYDCTLEGVDVCGACTFNDCFTKIVAVHGTLTLNGGKLDGGCLKPGGVIVNNQARVCEVSGYSPPPSLFGSAGLSGASGGAVSVHSQSSGFLPVVLGRDMNAPETPHVLPVLDHDVTVSAHTPKASSIGEQGMAKKRASFLYMAVSLLLVAASWVIILEWGKEHTDFRPNECFEYRTSSTDACNFGNWSLVLTEDGCRAASGFLSLSRGSPFRVDPSACDNKPPGCFIDRARNVVFFNGCPGSHSGIGGNRPIICQGMPVDDLMRCEFTETKVSLLGYVGWGMMIMACIPCFCGIWGLLALTRFDRKR
eukprot:Hpha_TRINITY_DN16326_c1_g2::TRINITY_DN16326_c1_g2_i1::g.60206::m.60206